MKASLPSTPEAARLYSQGLQKLRLLDALAARESLEKAAALDPDHAPTHSALAEAWSDSGMNPRQKNRQSKRVELSSRSSREERLVIEGRAHKLWTRFRRRSRAIARCGSFFPTTLTTAYFSFERRSPEDTQLTPEKTLSELRQLTLSDADTARIDLAEGRIAASVSDYKRTQALAQRAANRGRSVGANLLVATALQVEADAWEHMGQAQKALELSNQARALYVSAGDRRGVARTLLTEGDVLYDQSEFEAARKKFEDAFASVSRNRRTKERALRGRTHRQCLLQPGKHQ